MLFSPIEQFEVSSLVHIQAPILDYTTISLTNLGLYASVGVYLFGALHWASVNKRRIIPSRWGILVESLYDTVLGILESQIGKRQQQYFPMLYSLFMFILIINLLGAVTYGFSVTSSLAVTLGLSFVVFIGVTILSISIHGVKFLTFFVPAGVPNVLLPLLVPIEIVSYLSRSVSLGVRLFANLVSGHALLVILSGFLASGFTKSTLMFSLTLIPFALFILIVALEIAVAFIQAYVFTVLTASYIKDATYLH